MKILWIKSDFLHPTNRGGQIRTLEMLRRLHARHEVHYVGLEDAAQPEGVARSGEYCTRAYPVPHYAAPRRSLRFGAQLVRGLWSHLPVSIARYQSPSMAVLVQQLIQTEAFDSIVCDFLFPAVNVSDLSRVVLFEHNVESVIWERHTAVASNLFTRLYFKLQATRMREFERHACVSAGHVVTVSPEDSSVIRERFGVTRISDIPTGVDVEFFTPDGSSKHDNDLVFVGSMDWLPNIDGIKYFVREVLPLIRRARPGCSLAIVGRKPGPEILSLAKSDPSIRVSGTVDDVRPYLWGARVSIVPLRIGGGTRLKIFEAMAAHIPVVSTTIGAEGLEVSHPVQIRLADTPARFAAECLTLLDNPSERRSVAAAAYDLVSSRFSWDAVALRFESILATAKQSSDAS